MIFKEKPNKDIKKNNLIKIYNSQIDFTKKKHKSQKKENKQKCICYINTYNTKIIYPQCDIRGET